MKTLREAAQQALEALEKFGAHLSEDDPVDRAITALRAALEAEPQEPFCYMSEDYEVALLSEPPKPDSDFADMFPVYRAAPQVGRDALRYRWLRERLLAADFAWGEPATAVWVFETDAPISANLDDAIDAAMREGK